MLRIECDAIVGVIYNDDVGGSIIVSTRNDYLKKCIIMLLVVHCCSFPLLLGKEFVPFGTAIQWHFFGQFHLPQLLLGVLYTLGVQRGALLVVFLFLTLVRQKVLVRSFHHQFHLFAIVLVVQVTAPKAVSDEIRYIPHISVFGQNGIGKRRRVL
jgi:hypothetical protein